jgi:hypothetical protein
MNIASLALVGFLIAIWTASVSAIPIPITAYVSADNHYTLLLRQLQWQHTYFRRAQ